MKKVVFLLGALIFAGVVAFISCNQDEISSPDEKDLFQIAENEAVYETVLQNIEDMIDKEIDLLEKMNFDLTKLKSAEVAACDPKITVETPPNTKFPKTITLDYGSGCTDSEGNFRAGKVVVNITGPYWEKNTVRNAKLVDYLFNDLKVEGEKHETNKGTNDKGFYIFEVKRSIKISSAKGGELVCNQDWTRERIYDRGKDLKTINDDEVWVTGSTKVERNGTTTVKEITTPLNRKLSCKHFQSGTITSFVKKEKTAELDYGKGECDDLATWTNFKNNVTKTITLKTGINFFSTKK